MCYNLAVTGNSKTSLLNRPNPFPELADAMRAIVNAPKAKVDAAIKKDRKKTLKKKH